MMNIVSQIFNSGEVSSPSRSFRTSGTLFRLEAGQRQNIFESCMIGMDQDEGNWCLDFENNVESQNKHYYFPIHAQMNLTRFRVQTPKGEQACFQWSLPQGTILGCIIPLTQADAFMDLVCKQVAECATRLNQNHTHISYCKQLQSGPEHQHHSFPESTHNDIYDVMYMESQVYSTMLANTGRLYEVVLTQNKLIDDAVVFVIRNGGDFRYYMLVVDRRRKILLQKEITADMNYEINEESCYFRWVHLNNNSSSLNIYIIQFDKYDVPINIRFAFEQLFYESRHKKYLGDTLEEQKEMQNQGMEIEAQNQTNLDDLFKKGHSHILTEVKAPPVKQYESSRKKRPASLGSSLNRSPFVKVEPPSYIARRLQMEEEDQEDIRRKTRVHEGLERYRSKRSIFQGKIQNYTIQSYSNNISYLTLRGNELQSISETKLFTKDNLPLVAQKIVLHDGDNKAMILSEGGQLSYYDLQHGKLIQEYAPSGIQDICPERKLAETGQYSTFMAITQRALHRVDPRVGSQAFGFTHDYRRGKKFSQVTTTVDGELAVGSRQGQLRLYPDERKESATSRIAGLGESVLSLDTTKDKRWLLATFKNYLILLPTAIGESTLYHKKTLVEARPQAKKLTIRPSHLQMCKVTDFTLINAKFDESTDSTQKYIVSGFNNYIVVWSLSRILNNQDFCYTFSKSEETVNQAQFRFNDISKMLMATTKKVRVKEGSKY